MAAKLLSGKVFADAIKSETAVEIKALEIERGFRPCLAVVRVGLDPASEVYVTNKVKTAAEIGIISEHHHLPADTSNDDLLELIRELNANDDVDGILVQLPLPQHIDERKILETIDPAKDVDGFHPVNVGKLSLGYPVLTPCTPAGVIEILKRSNIEIAGKHAVVVGRSNIVGKPMASLLLKENATVTICHSRTVNLPEITQKADILVAAIGHAGFIRGEHIREGSTVIDVGINKLTDAGLVNDYFPPGEIEQRLNAIKTRGFTLVGDVNPKDAMETAAYFTPVPGGVGLLTVAMLMKNTVAAARLRRGI